MEVYGYIGLLIVISIMILFVSIFRRWSKGVEINCPQFQKNEFIEKMLEDQFIGEVNSEDLIVKKVQKNPTTHIEENTIQFLITQKWFLLRFFLFKNFSEHSLIGFIVTHNLFKNQMSFTCQVEHSIILLTPLLMYGFWGALISNLCSQQILQAVLIIILNVFASLNILIFYQYQKTQTQEKELNFQKLINHLANNMDIMNKWFPRQASKKVARNLEKDFSGKVDNEISHSQQQDIQQQNFQSRKKLVQSIVVSFFVISLIIFVSYTSRMQSPWMIYGILLGLLFEQLQRSIFCLILARQNLISYHYQKDNEVNFQIQKYGKLYMKKYNNEVLKSPSRQKSQNLDRNSPLKYLIQQIDPKMEHQEQKQRSSKKTIGTVWNDQMDELKQQDPHGVSELKNEEPSQLDEMNSGDNLISAQQSQSQRKELNDFSSDDIRGHQSFESPQELILFKETNNVIKNIIENNASVDIQAVFIKKRHLNVDTTPQTILPISSRNQKLPPVLVKKNDKVIKTRKKVKENYDPSSPEELKMVSINNPVVNNTLQVQNVQVQNMTKSSYHRNNVYKTSREEEEIIFTNNSKMKISNSHVGRSIELPRIDLLTQSKTMDLRSAKRSESLEVPKKIIQDSPYSEQLPNILRNMILEEPKQTTTLKKTNQKKLSQKILQIVKVYDGTSTQQNFTKKISIHSKQDKQLEDNFIDLQ